MGNATGKSEQQPENQISLQLPGGDVYKGTHHRFVPHGHGKLKFHNGDVYVGEFKNGVFEGTGKMFFHNGEFYKGEWHAGKPSGLGHYFYNDFSRYNGEFRNGLPDGKGRLYTFRKECFKGTFAAGQKSGKGERITQKGEIIDEEWQNGFLVSSFKNIQKSDVIVKLKNDHEQLVRDQEEAAQVDATQNQEQRIERMAETYLKHSSDEEKNKFIASNRNSQTVGEGFDNLSYINFTQSIGDFRRKINAPRVKKWTVGQVCELLDAFGFGHYKEVFKSNKMDGEAMLKMKEKDYADVGVLELKDKILMRDLVAKLKSYDRAERRKERRNGRRARQAFEETEAQAEQEEREYQMIRADSAANEPLTKEIMEAEMEHKRKNRKLNHFRETEVGLKQAKEIMEEAIGARSPNNNRTFEDSNADKGRKLNGKNHHFDRSQVIMEESENNQTERSSTVRGNGIKKRESKDQNDTDIACELRKAQTSVQRKPSTSEGDNSVKTEHGTAPNQSDYNQSVVKHFDEISNQMSQADSKFGNWAIQRASTNSEAAGAVTKKNNSSNNKQNQLSLFQRMKSDNTSKNRKDSYHERKSKSDNVLNERHDCEFMPRFSIDDHEAPAEILKPHSFTEPNDGLSPQKFIEMKNASFIALYAKEEEGKDNFSSDHSSSKSSESRGQDEFRSQGRKRRRKPINFDISEEIGPELKSFLVEPDDIRLNEKIGVGAQTSVWKGVYQHTDVAIKVFTNDKIPGGRKKFLEEAEILSSLRSTYIVLFMGLCVKFPQYYILTEYMEDGNLADNLYERPKARALVLNNWSVKLKIIESIAHGMNYLHQMNVFHCDLKPSNILVRSSAVRQPKSDQIMRFRPFAHKLKDKPPKIRSNRRCCLHCPGSAARGRLSQGE